nr:ADP-ribosylation factor-like protein 2 [Aotus nancymaae]
MGLLAILKKMKQKEREVRLLHCCILPSARATGVAGPAGRRCRAPPAGSGTRRRRFQLPLASPRGPTIAPEGRGNRTPAWSWGQLRGAAEMCLQAQRGRAARVSGVVDRGGFQAPAPSRAPNSGGVRGGGCGLHGSFRVDPTVRLFVFAATRAVMSLRLRMCGPECPVRLLSPPAAPSGLDNAGKTTILKKFNGEDIDTISPTLGFNIKTLEHRGFKLNIWDVGGQKSLRSYWRNYFESTDGLIWVVDSADRQRMQDCQRELQSLLLEERLAGATLLIFANKQDLPGALSSNAIREALELDSIRSHHWCIQGCSAVTGENLLQGIDWLLDDISSRIFTAE